ncbi:MAG: ABC transporter ATP-binding protein [Bacteroidota bacterium]|nr:ABC transporter ATP-binding protein [Bacteroidota bacterium]
MATLDNRTLFKRIMVFVKPYGWRFRLIILWSILLSIFAALRPYLLKQTVDEYIEPKDSYGLLLFIVSMAVLLLLEVISQFFFVYWSNWLGQDIVKDIRNKLFAHLSNFRVQYFDNTPVGQLVTRSVFDIESISKIFSQGLFMIISDIMKMFVTIAFMCYMNWKLTIIVLLSFPLLIYIIRIFQQKMKKAFEEVRTEVSNLNIFVQERLTGMKIIQLFTREDVEYQNFKSINSKHRKAWLKNILYNSIFFPVADIIASITLGTVIWYGTRDIINMGNTTIGDLITYSMLVNMLFNPIRHIADKFNEMQMGMIASNRIFDILDTDESQNNGSLNIHKIKGDIQFKNVHFAYKPEQPILRDINLNIKQGQTIAIVGSTGAGKTSIINLLNRFYEIDSGEILIDGTNIQEYTLDSLRKRIGVVLQDVFLFADTIYNNIALFNPNITKEQVIEAAKQIGVHNFITSLPEGYDYNVKERGSVLSTGQRQLIAFLRAYLNNPDILILDEATSSIDSHSEQLIQKATNILTQNRTSILIAHRLATIVKADVIVVMDKGHIVEQGTHQELLQKTDGMYRKLYESQFS